MNDKLEKDCSMSTETTMAAISNEDNRDKQDKTSVELLPQKENVTSGDQLEDRSDDDSTMTKYVGVVILEKYATDVKMNTFDEANPDQGKPPVTDLYEPELRTDLATPMETERNTVADTNVAERHLNVSDALNTEEHSPFRIDPPNTCGRFPVDIWALICDVSDNNTLMTLRGLNSNISHCADRVLFRKVDFGLHPMLVNYFQNIATSEKLRHFVQEVTILDFNLQMLNETWLKHLMTWEEWQQHTRNFRYELELNSAGQSAHILKHAIASLPNLQIIKTRQSYRIFDKKEETTDSLGNVVSKWRPKDMEQVISQRWKWGNWNTERHRVRNPPLPMNPRLLEGVMAAVQNSEREKSLREIDVLIPQDFWFRMGPRDLWFKMGPRLHFFANVRVMRLTLYLDRTAQLPLTILYRLARFILSAPSLEVLRLEIRVDPKLQLEATLGGRYAGANFAAPGGLFLNCRVPGIRGVPPFNWSPLNENNSLTANLSAPNPNTVSPNSDPDPGSPYLNDEPSTEGLLGCDNMEIRGGKMPNLGPILTQALEKPWHLLSPATVLAFYGLTGHIPGSPQVLDLQHIIGDRIVALNHRLFRGPPADIGTILSVLQLPNLRDLSIEGASSQSFAMETFLERHSGTLRSLSLSSFHLKEVWEDADLRHALWSYPMTTLPTCNQGPWEKLMNNIKPCMKLDSVNLWELADMKILYFCDVLSNVPILTNQRWREKYDLWNFMLGRSLVEANVPVESLAIY